ncbi:translin [Contarinia nasturtii]|uniref:translin n=1 Tax=Contarinia nasturtii TaxID=265458 RepID=UPI0012D42DDC|nr:translin [Contarinia nasturtii]
MARAPKELFTKFQDHLNNEQEVRDEIRSIIKEIDLVVRDSILSLQVIHTSLTEVSSGCLKAREQFEICNKLYAKLAKMVPVGQYYRYNDHWSYLTQRIVFLIALTVFLEVGTLVERDTVAEILGLKTNQNDGFHLDIEDYLQGVLQLASELSRFATNAVTLGDYERPIQISRFVADLSAGFRLLNLKNDGLRKRFDGLKYDVKKIEEIVYDISIRRLRPTEADSAPVGQVAE